MICLKYRIQWTEIFGIKANNILSELLFESFSLLIYIILHRLMRNK